MYQQGAARKGGCLWCIGKNYNLLTVITIAGFIDKKVIADYDNEN